MPVLAADYFKTIATFVNQEKEDLLKFIFKLFDVFNEDKITEAGLFKFLEDASIRRVDIPAVPLEILKLDEQENDIFIDIFTDTYTRISHCIQRKVKNNEKKAE